MYLLNCGEQMFFLLKRITVLVECNIILNKKQLLSLVNLVTKFV